WNVGMIVPDDPDSGRLFDGGAKLRVTVAPEHLVMSRGAVQIQPALFIQVKQSAAGQKIIARPGLAAAIRLRQRRLIYGLKRRDFVDNVADPIQQTASVGRI